MNKRKRVVSGILLLLNCLGVTDVIAAKVQPITLTAHITVNNQSDRDINGYIHRISIPVANHLQQKLVRIRYDYPEKPRRRSHKNSDSEYLEFSWNIPAHTSSIRKVHFELEVADFDFTRGLQATAIPKNMYLQPSRFVESNAPQVRRLASQIEQTYESDEGRLKAAFLAPQQMIRYREQSSKGALFALNNGEGDCTEYAALFVALARSMGYPARLTSDFLFTSRKTFSQPNHHSAEVYFSGQWIPVDPNLALEPRFGYGFGVGKGSKIIINRDSVWVWSNLWPKDLRGLSDLTDVDVKWTID